MDTLVLTELEKHFLPYRENVIGINQQFETPYGTQTIVYADWTASGRLYEPIENLLKNEIAPFVGNTHTETTVTGCSMTKAYHEAVKIIKKHVHASADDVLISCNSGMTGVVNKLQRILGLRVADRLKAYTNVPDDVRPIIFLTHMEHHSNHTTWLETICDVVVVDPNHEGLVCLKKFKEAIQKHADRKFKIAAISACSNVTGIETPYHEIAELIHEVDGYCFVDFACSAPYVPIKMHTENPNQKLDAIFFSPHKFLGGPATTGIVVFCKSLYSNAVPDNPGGGTVAWTNPWGRHAYFDDIESREDGGTPAFLQTIKVALCVQLKEQMTSEAILKREHELMDILWDGISNIPKVKILAEAIKDRLGIISFYIEDMHYNLAVKILNDRFGIQVRGGCSCAGTYGHYLLQVSEEHSKTITDQIDAGDCSAKPGWIRLSIHPVMTNAEAHFLVNSIREVVEREDEFALDYTYSPACNEYTHITGSSTELDLVKSWFDGSFL